MRIAIVTWRFPEPTEPFIVNKVAGLVERGIDCVVIADDVVEHADPPALRAVREHVEVLPTQQHGRRRSRYAVLDVAADVVHFEHAGVALQYRHLITHLRAPIVVTCRGSTVRVDAASSLWKQDGLAEIFAAVDRVHCVSEELASHCLDLGGLPEQVVVWPTGVDLRTFTARTGAPRPETLALRIVSVGRRHWVKGYEYAVRAIRLLRDRGQRVTYTIVGLDEGSEGAIRLAIQDDGLQDAVRLVGHLPPSAVRDVLASSDVFLLPSLSEGASVATMEAMAMGLPVVVTDVGGMRSVVRDGIDGHIVPARDPSAIADAISALQPPAVREEMGARAAEAARAKFDAAVAIDRACDLYRDLVSAGAARVADVAPVVSVVVIARNAAATIDAQLRALAFQELDEPWEVVVVDNRCTDDTRARALAWADRLPVRVVDAPERASIPYARNVGVRAARADRILMTDADDVVAPGWLAAHAAALDGSGVAVGPLERALLMPRGTSEDEIVDQGPTELPGYRLRVLTSNVGFRREVFDRIGGFDEGLTRGSDVDFGWRAMDHGYEPVFVPEAVVHFRPRQRLLDVARQGFADGRVAPALYLRHRATGMPLLTPGPGYRYRTIARDLAPAVRTPERRPDWIYDAAQALGRVVGSATHRVAYL